MRFWLSLHGPGRQPNDPFLAQGCFEARLSSGSLESLIGFYEYLEPTLWLKKHKLSKNSSSTNGNLYHFG